MDLGGPKIEFYSLLFEGFQQQRIVIGSSPSLTFSHYILPYDRKEYEVWRVLVALSMMNGCSGPHHNVCPSLVQYTKIWFINGVDNVNWPPYRD